MALATQGRGDGGAQPRDQAPQQQVTRPVPGRRQDRPRTIAFTSGSRRTVAVAIHNSTKSTGRRSAAPLLIWGAQRRRPVGPRGVVDSVTHYVDDMQLT